MHRTAEYGIAAHWKYKERKDATVADPAGMSEEMGWLKQLLDWQREAQDPEDFLDALRYDLGAGRTRSTSSPRTATSSPLPSGSTPVDFAYAVHTEVGHRCIGARVNTKLVALESALENGDTVEVFTSKAETAGPSRDWLEFVKSPRARTKIKQWFARERREDAIDAGKTALSKAMRKAALPIQRLLGGDQLLTLAHDMHYADIAALYAAIGEGHVSAQSVVHKLVNQLGGAEGAVEDIAEAMVPTGELPDGRAAAHGRRRRRRGQGRQRRLGQAGPLLHAGARRRDHRLRHPRRGSVGAPQHVHELDRAARAARAPRRGRVGALGRVQLRRSRSRSRPSTGTACSPTSPGC